MKQTTDQHREQELCPYDYLLFQDGPFPFSTNLTKRICGTTSEPPPNNITSNSGYMRIIFHTDEKTQRSGFTLRYRFEPLSDAVHDEITRKCGHATLT